MTNKNTRPDDAALARRTQNAMRSIERRRQTRHNGELIMGAAFSSFGRSAADGRLSPVIWAGRLAIAGVALILCAAAYFRAL